ncbi:MAG: NAD(P)/FAD-dependent oxidoreductase, partial [Microthrixaceae bacterium]
GMDRTPMNGDDELVAIACRRTTFEWVLRRTVLDEGIATLRHGEAVEALVTNNRPATRDSTANGSRPHVSGVRLTDGTELTADAVVLAGGRRMDVPALFGALGVELAESEEDTGIIYLSRCYRLRDGADYPSQLGPIGGDLGYLKYGVFQGDDRTFSITLATNTGDTELRNLLLDEDTFTEAAKALPATTSHVGGRAEPITGVEVMGGLINRRREFTVDGMPLVTGVHAVGDAHTATNPLYGRGCSLAMAQAGLLTEALAEPDPLDAAQHYEAACRREILPWHSAAVAQDRMNKAASAANNTQAEFARSILREGLFPAMREDPVVLRAFLRMFNLLEPPDSLMGNADVVGRVMTAYQNRDSRPPEAPLGPDRQQLVATLSATSSG